MIGVVIINIILLRPVNEQISPLSCFTLSHKGINALKSSARTITFYLVTSGKYDEFAKYPKQITAICYKILRNRTMLRCRDEM